MDGATGGWQVPVWVAAVAVADAVCRMMGGRGRGIDGQQLMRNRWRLMAHDGPQTGRLEKSAGGGGAGAIMRAPRSGPVRRPPKAREGVERGNAQPAPLKKDPPDALIIPLLCKWCIYRWGTIFV